MKKLIQRWILHFKRKRYHRYLRESGNYKTLENSVKETGALCSNCNAPLTGPFCHICGQKDDDLKRPIWTLLREILDDVFSPDSRLFKTLILLVLVPGGLTRAFRDGRRARFVPPLRLYLVISILFFVILKVADILILDIHVTPIDRPDTVEAPLDPAQPDVALGEKETGLPVEQETARLEAVPSRTPEEQAEHRAALEEKTRPLFDELQAAADNANSAADEAVTDGTKPAAKEGLSRKDLAALQNDDLTAEERVRLVLGDEGFERLPEETKKAIRESEDGKNINIDGDELLKNLLGNPRATGKQGDVRVETDWPYDVEISMFVKNSKEPREGLKQEDIDEILNDPEQPAILKQATRGFSEALQDPSAFNELFNDWLPPALFVLMPIFAFILRLFHWGKDRVYLQQFVFSLHFHTFLFMLMTAMTVIVPAYGGEMAYTVFWCVTSVYLIIALKVGQGQGWLKAFFKAGPIWVTYFVLMMMVMFFIVFAGLGDIDMIDLLMGDTSAFETEV